MSSALLAIALLTVTVALPAAATASDGETVHRGSSALASTSTGGAADTAAAVDGPCVVISTDPPDAGVYLNCPSEFVLG